MNDKLRGGFKNTTVLTSPADFRVRLVSKEEFQYKGRVEVEIGGLWGTVSDQGWDMNDANVVCRELGYGGMVGAYSGSLFGPGKGPVWMSDFKCEGSETSLAKCNHNDTRVYRNYHHYRDAGVECYGKKTDFSMCLPVALLSSTYNRI